VSEVMPKLYDYSCQLLISDPPLLCYNTLGVSQDGVVYITSSKHYALRWCCILAKSVYDEISHSLCPESRTSAQIFFCLIQDQQHS